MRSPSASYGANVVAGIICPVPHTHWHLGETTGNFMGVGPNAWQGVPGGTLYRGSPDIAGTDGAVAGDSVDWGTITFPVNVYGEYTDPSYWSGAAWVNFEEAESGVCFVLDNVESDAATPTVYKGWRFSIQPGGFPQFGIWAADGSVQALNSPVSIKDGLPHHIAFTVGPKDGSGIIAIYIDGNVVVSATRTKTPGYTVDYNALRISPRTTLIDEVSFWQNTTLTAEQIANLYYGGTDQWPLPPYAARGNAFIQIYGPDNDSGIWGTSKWGEAKWAGLSWQDITPESMIVDITWGADDPQGVLTQTAAGSWSVKTFDPKRLLDPSNGNSPFTASLRPGRPIKIFHWIPGPPAEYHQVRIGLIDEINYSLTDKTGEIRGTDGIALLANAAVLPGVTGVPNTLRARADWLLRHVNMQNLFTIGPLSPDPEVGPFPPDKEVSVWTALNDAAYDCLYAVWLDRYAGIQFRAYGSPVDNGFTVGADGIPLESMDVASNLSNVYTRIVAYDRDAPETEVIAYDAGKATYYGDITLRRQDPVPYAQQWADRVLADRSGAALQYNPGILFPQTHEDLVEILNLQMLDIMHIRLNKIYPAVDIPVRILGGAITIDTGTGWTAKLSGYIPASEWDEIQSPPVEPPVPPDEKPPTKVVKRTYNCTKSTTVMLESSDGGHYGAGKNPVNPFGKWQGDKFRTFFDFEDIDFSDVVALQRCDLKVTNSDQNNVGFGDTPKATIRRITESWEEGTYGTGNNYGNNATVWPGPSTTATDSVTRDVSRSENGKVTLAISNIGRAWMRGSKQYGVAIFSGGEDSEKYTGEFWSHENSTSNKRPVLELTLEVLA